MKYDFIRLTGMSPFHGKSYNEILIKNKNCEIKFNIKAGHSVSDQGNVIAVAAAFIIILLAIDLLTKMLAKDPKNRATAKECLEHVWMVSGGAVEVTDKPQVTMLSSAQENMKRFQEEYFSNISSLSLVKFLIIGIDLM